MSIPAVFLGLGLSYTPTDMFATLYSTIETQRWRIDVLNMHAAWLDMTPPQRHAVMGGLADRVATLTLGKRRKGGRRGRLNGGDS